MNRLSPKMTLKETAYQYIRKCIVDGVWSGGTFLSEHSLCEQLGMSKTPIRSALDRLEMMGLVKLFPNQGAVVSEVSLKRILEIYELRLALETYAVRWLTGKLDHSFFVRMDNNISLQATSITNDDIPEYVRLDRQFHEMIIAGLDNEEYAAVMMRMQDQFLLAVRTTFMKNRQRLEGSIEEHRKIRAALAGNDPERSERLMIEHLEFVKRIML